MPDRAITVTCRRHHDPDGDWFVALVVDPDNSENVVEVARVRLSAMAHPGLREQFLSLVEAVMKNSLVNVGVKATMVRVP